MANITFSVFSFLKKEFQDRGIECSRTPTEIPDNITVNQLIENFGFNSDQVEAVFINHKIMSKNTTLKDGDRIALVPPGGIPGHVAGYVGAMGRE